MTLMVNGLFSLSGTDPEIDQGGCLYGLVDLEY